MSHSEVCINDILGPDTLSRILQILCNELLDRESTMKGFKKALTLGAVCQHWRLLLTPILSQVAIIAAERQKVVMATRVDIDFDSFRTPSLPRYNWTSNIPYIMHSAMCVHTRELRIISDGFAPVSNVVGVLEATGFGSGLWDNLNTLTFIGPFIDTSDVQPCYIEAMGAYLTEKMSAIAEFNFGDTFGDDLYTGLCEMLQRHYAPSLHSISLRTWPSIQHIDQFSENLTKVDIDSLILGNTPRPPLFPSSQLVSLKIRNFNRDRIWDHFEADSQGIIHFSQLKKLEIEYQRGMPEKPLISVDGLNIEFPRLTILRVSNSAKVYSNFYRLFQLSPIQAIRCHDGPAQLNSIDARIIQSAVQINLVATKNGAGLACDAFQRIVSVQSSVAVARLAINDSLVRFIDALEWPNLRYLFLTLDRIRLMEFQSLLAKLPRLWHLGLWCDSPHPFSYRSSFLKASISARSKMFSTSIQELTLGVTYRWTIKDFMLLERFAQRLPSLQRLRVSNESLPMFANFIGHPGTRVEVVSLEHRDECEEC